jgi:small-conductance mechanosensitive channel
MKFRFSAGDRVQVSDGFFWAKGALGTIATPPDAVTTISGKWDGDLIRQENSALGTNTVYWLWFNEPQLDANGDGPYRGGSIWEDALTILSK